MKHVEAARRSVQLFAVGSVLMWSHIAGAGGAVTPTAARPKPAPSEAREPVPEWQTEIEKAFQSRISFEFVESPLDEVLDFLQDTTGVTFVLDPPAVPKVPTVTLRVRDMRAESALKWILKVVGLEYALRDEAVLVSTADVIRQEPQMRVYDLREIVDMGEEEECVDTIRSVTPSLWEKEGHSIAALGRRLIVRLPTEHHKSLERTLEQLRVPRPVRDADRAEREREEEIGEITVEDKFGNITFRLRLKRKDLDLPVTQSVLSSMMREPTQGAESGRRD